MKAIFYILILICGLTHAQSEQRFTLLYQNNAYELTEEHHQRLDSLREIINKSDFDIHIKGYTNSIGSREYNLGLSRRRAALVKNELNEFTIISTRGFGELKGKSANNRRVDVLIHLKTDHVTQENEIIDEPTAGKKKKSSITTLEPKKGDKLVLEGIRFYADRDVIRNESKEALEDLIEFLQKNPKVRLRLIGHVCCGDRENPGIDARNARTGKRNLSEARARVMYNYLVKQGIDKRRIRYTGMAYRDPTNLGDEYDMRVEIEIISVD